MTTNELIEEKCVFKWPQEEATLPYILYRTNSAQNSIEKGKTIGSHELSLSFGPFYVSFCTINIRQVIEETESFLNSVAVVPYGLLKYPTDSVVIRSNKSSQEK